MELFLEKTIPARERKNKDRAIARLLQEEHVRTKEYPIDLLTEIVGEVLALDRYWRKILEERESLRGSDYGDKDKLEAEHQLDLNYVPNFEKDIKMFDNLK